MLTRTTTSLDMQKIQYINRHCTCRRAELGPQAGKLIIFLVHFLYQKGSHRTSLVLQWLGLHTPKSGGLSSIPGQGTTSHML